MDSCSRVGLLFDDIVASVEVVNSQNVQLQCTGRVPTVAVDKTDGIQVGPGLRDIAGAAAEPPVPKHRAQSWFHLQKGLICCQEGHGCGGTACCLAGKHLAGGCALRFGPACLRLLMWLGGQVKVVYHSICPMPLLLSAVVPVRAVAGCGHYDCQVL